MSQPEIVFRHGPCSAAIFVNEVVRGEHVFKISTVTFQRRYLDRDGQWKSTTELRVNDIPKATLVLSKCYEYLTSNSVYTEEPDDCEEGSQNSSKPEKDTNSKVAEQQKKAIVNLLKRMGIDEDKMEPLLKQRYGLTLDDLSYEQRANIIKKLSAEANGKKAA